MSSKNEYSQFEWANGTRKTYNELTDTEIRDGKEKANPTEYSWLERERQRREDEERRR